MTGCARIAAMILRSPPQFGQCSRSSSNTRLSRLLPVATPYAAKSWRRHHPSNSALLRVWRKSFGYWHSHSWRGYRFNRRAHTASRRSTASSPRWRNQVSAHSGHAQKTKRNTPGRMKLRPGGTRQIDRNLPRRLGSRLANALLSPTDQRHTSQGRAHQCQSTRLGNTQVHILADKKQLFVPFVNLNIGAGTPCAIWITSQLEIHVQGVRVQCRARARWVSRRSASSSRAHARMPPLAGAGHGPVRRAWPN